MTVFWLGEFHGLYSQSMGSQSRTQLNDFHPQARDFFFLIGVKLIHLFLIGG